MLKTSPPRFPKRIFRTLFEQFGTIAEINVVKDRMTGLCRGAAFVTMSNVGEGRAAINGLKGKEVRGRLLVVNEARSKEDLPKRSFPKVGFAVNALVIDVKLSGHVFRVFIRNVCHRFLSFHADGNSIRARFVTPGCS